MCYLIAKKFGETGGLALKTEHGPKLVSLKKKIAKQIGYDKVQLVTISRPSAYGEYEPYEFVNSECAFEKKVLEL